MTEVPNASDVTIAAAPGRDGRGLRWRLFVTVWLVYSAHFATNVVREHYPAFSLVERGSLQVDPYVGLHSDIFIHENGHAYINSNVGTSLVAAVPLFLFAPALDALERYERGRQRTSGRDGPIAEYRTPKPNRQAFFAAVKERGLTLRFGAATAITSVLLMAPLSAVMVALLFSVLQAGGIARSRSVWLALLFAFGTPMFFRTAPLNPNMLVLYAVFPAFLLLWRREAGASSLGHRAAAGALAGCALAVDYSAVVPLLVLYGYLLLARVPAAGWARAFRESLAFVLGSVPPVLVLMYTQWSMFGNPFLPARAWMEPATFTDRGWQGMSVPSLDLLVGNLIDPAYGLYAFGPLLVLGLVPPRVLGIERRVLPRRERIFVMALFMSLLLFSSANQYARMQWNTGFRYLAPLVPFLYLQASDLLRVMPRRWLGLVTLVAVGHSWVTAMGRESVPESWRLVLTEGVQLPWLRVLTMMLPPDSGLIASPVLPLGLLAVLLVAVTLLWLLRIRRARS